MAKSKKSAVEGRNPKSGSSARVKRKAPSPSVKKGGKTASPARPACEKCGAVHKRCTAHNKAGGPCGQQARRGSGTCRNHGGNAPQVRKAADERLRAMLLPALAQLERVLTKPDTNDSDRIKAALAILNRTGYNERQQIELGLREPSPFDELTKTFIIQRGKDNVIDAADRADALPSGGGGGSDIDEALEEMLDRRERDRQREAQTHIQNRGHEVVEGSVQRNAMDPFDRDAKERADAEHERTEYEDQTRLRSYEDRLREGVADPWRR